MPPRRSRAPPGPNTTQTTLADLSDALLTRILGCLEQRDRHSAALVSRRWHACAHAPALCRSITVCADYQDRKLESFLAWLLRHAGLVRYLRIELQSGGAEEQQLLAGCLCLCAAAAQLERLSVECDSLCVAAWAPALMRLTALRLSAAHYRSQLSLSSSLHCLAALRKLSLSCLDRIEWRPGVRLPAGLEELELEDHSDALPGQLSGLTALHTLVLTVYSVGADGYGVLEALPALRRLHLKYSFYLPACLGRLTGLEDLLVEEGCRNADAATAALGAALPSLTRLTSLALIGIHAAAHVPPTIASLTSLRRVCLCRTGAGGEGTAAGAPLPAGEWARGLSMLSASYDVLASSLPMLTAASQLQQLGICGGAFDDDELAVQSAAFWSWARAHRPLQQLRIDVLDPDQRLHADLLSAVVALMEANPGVKVRCHNSTEEYIDDRHGIAEVFRYRFEV